MTAMLAGVPAAHGWSGTTDGSVHAGPALAGSGTAWADGQQGGPMNVKRAPLDGPPATLFTIDRRAPCDRIEDLAASGALVAVKVHRDSAAGQCENAGVEVHVSDGAGGSRLLEASADGSSPCAASGIDIDGGTVAVGRYNCQQDPVLLYDFATGAPTDLGMELPGGWNPLAVRIAGRHVAVVVKSWMQSDLEVVVWDRETGKERYRADADAIRDGADYVSGSHRLELQPDGRVLYGVGTLDGARPVQRWAWASPAEPTLHLIPGSWGDTRGRVGFVGNMVALPSQWGSAGAAVIGLNGALMNAFTDQHPQRSLDFDGTRIVWADLMVHNEAYPYQPPPKAPPGPASQPAPPPAPKAASAPAAVASPVRATMQAKALKAFAGVAADADGDLALVRVGLVRVAKGRCETLQRSGRLARIKLTGGKCTPRTWLATTGTTSWKLKLRKRLPAGRYALYVQAADAAGNAQMEFSKAIGNLRTFTLR